MISTYGIGNSVRQPAITGESLAATGLSQQRSATEMLGSAAEAESRRELANRQAKQNEKAGNTSLGSTFGAIAGLVLSGGSPWGAAIGSALGGIGASLF